LSESEYVATGSEDAPVTVNISEWDLVDSDWVLHLPHQCDAWIIAAGKREDVLTEARRFRAELDQAITALEAEAAT
jgi:hypothetical protein